MARKAVRILSLDGGGIRGIIPASVLTLFEARLQALSKKPSARIADYFDYVAGTSTGGIIAAGLLTPKSKNSKRPKFTARKLLDFYTNHGDEVFSTSFWGFASKARGMFDERHNVEGLERLLKSYFGDTRLEDLLRPCVIPTYMIDGRELSKSGKRITKMAQPFFFRQQRLANLSSKDRSGNYRFLVRDAARATSAAPTFFEPARIYTRDKKSWYALVDGGLYANDPAMVALTDVLSGASGIADPHLDDIAIFSLGTGVSPVRFDYIDAMDWGYLSWAAPAISMAMRGSSQTVNFQLKNLYKNAANASQYLRINPAIPKSNDDMDDARKENVSELVKIGFRTAKSHEKKMDAFIADHLL